MKTSIIRKGFYFLAGLIFTSGLIAQSEVQVKIVKDGKVIKDTTYLVEEESSTKMAVKMLDLTLGEKMNKKGSNVYAFKSKDGRTYEFRTGDDSVNNSYEHSYYFSGDHDAENIIVTVDEDGKKVIKKDKILKKSSDEEGEKEVIVIKKNKKVTEGGDEIEWIEKGDHKVLIIDDGSKEKAVKILKDQVEGENSEFTTDEGKKIIIKESIEGEQKEITVKVVDNEKEEKKERKEEKKKEK